MYYYLNIYIYMYTYFFISFYKYMCIHINIFIYLNNILVIMSPTKMVLTPSCSPS